MTFVSLLANIEHTDARAKGGGDNSLLFEETKAHQEEGADELGQANFQPILDHPSLEGGDAALPHPLLLRALSLARDRGPELGAWGPGLRALGRGAWGPGVRGLVPLAWGPLPGRTARSPGGAQGPGPRSQGPRGPAPHGGELGGRGMVHVLDVCK